jgi:hypothetical protein
MKTTTSCAAEIGFFGLSVGALAKDRFVELWQCKPKNDATTDDIQALNHKWLEFVNSQVKGGGVRSFMLLNVVGAGEGFDFADSYPSMEALGCGKGGAQDKGGSFSRFWPDCRGRLHEKLAARDEGILRL